MTLGESIDKVLNRAGLAESSTKYTDDARTYLSMFATELIHLVPWWFLDRTTTFDTVDGTRTYQPVSGPVTTFYSFTDQTNARPLTALTPDEYDLTDPDRDDSGTVEAVSIEGVDATTGYPVVGLWRTPDDAYTIRVRYRIDIAEWASTDDASEMTTLGIPPIIRNALIYGATSLFLEELGDDSSSQRETVNMKRAIVAAQKRNLDMIRGNRRNLPKRDTGGALIRVGSSLAEE